jgi:RNase H-fold protein (predicted Holliday junction resolvase)
LSKNRNATYEQIVEGARIPKVDRTTLSKFMRKNKIKTVVASKKTRIPEDVKRMRMNYANYFLRPEYDKTEFYKFIFTDECIFTNNVNRLLIKLDYSKETKDDFQNLQNLYEIKLNFYGFVTFNKFHLIKISNNFCKEEFFDLLVKKGYLDQIRTFSCANSYFVQDNSSCHEFPAEKSISIRSLISSIGYTYVDFPPYSPDMNIIENIWKIIKDKLKKFVNNNPNCNIDELETEIIKIANLIDEKTIRT